MRSKSPKIYQLKIALEGSKPPIWRRVLVDSSYDLVQLHAVIQISMGWTNSHLHQFIHGQTFYSPPNPFDDGFMETEDSSQYRIDHLLLTEKDHMRYEYDFGDGWLHRVTLEKVLPMDKDAALPQCIKGKMACPPEDVGGLWGYADFVETIADEKHPDHGEMLDWVGGEFDPVAFDQDAVNAELQAVFC